MLEKVLFIVGVISLLILIVITIRGLICLCLSIPILFDEVRGSRLKKYKGFPSSRGKKK
jgi:hypothetical protein